MARFFSRPARRRFIALLGAFFLAVSLRTSLAQTNMADFPIPRTGALYPAGIIYSPATSNYWFTELLGGALDNVDLISNVVTEVFLTNNGGAGPFAFTRTSDGALWFTEAYANNIGRLDPITTNYAEYALSNNVNRLPATIVVGPDGNLWFTEQYQNRLAAISTNAYTNSYGQLYMKESPEIRSNTQIFGLAVGSDSNLWFTEESYGIIGRYNIASNTYVEFALPNVNCSPFFIVNGPDGALWFTEQATNAIGRITTNGHYTEFELPLLPGYSVPDPFGIVSGPDGNIWFTENYGSAVGRITPAGIVTLFPTATPNSYPLFITTGGDSNIWFTEYASQGTPTGIDRVGRLIVSQALSLSAPATISAPPTALGPTLIGSFKNSDSTNTVLINWGDGTASSLIITNSILTSHYFATTNPVVTVGSTRYTNILTISNTAPLGTNFSNGSFNIYASHTFASFSNYPGNLSVTDSSNDLAFANITFQVSPLGINAAGAHVLLYWPTNATNVSLYQNTNLLTTNWTKVTNSIVVTNGLNQVTLPAASGTEDFFRLQ